MSKPCARCNESELITPEKAAALALEIPLAGSLTADEKILEKRICECRKCEALRGDVFCAHCGCMIIFRARNKKNYCPHPDRNKWMNF